MRISLKHSRKGFKAAPISHAKSTVCGGDTLSLWQTAWVCVCVLGFECVLVEVSVISWKTCQSQRRQMSPRRDHIKPGHLITKARNGLSELQRSLLPAEDEQGQGPDIQHVTNFINSWFSLFEEHLGGYFYLAKSNNQLGESPSSQSEAKKAVPSHRNSSDTHTHTVKNIFKICYHNIFSFLNSTL